MNEDRQCILWCAWLIAAACLFRLLSGNIVAEIAAFFCRPSAVAAMMYLETGRVIHREVPTEPQATEKTEIPLPVITRQEGEQVDVAYIADIEPDFGALAEEALCWDLTDGQPAVLILHTHAMESYEKNGEDYDESSPYRTANPAYNMVSVGHRVAEILEANGIRVIHDDTLHDAASYEDAYDSAKASAEDYLAQYPSIRLILDLHRDAVERDGQQYAPTCMTDGEESAKLMFVMGTDVYYDHPYWEENLAIAVKLQAILSRSYPDLCRPLQLTNSRYNQQIHSGYLLVEVGTAGNTHEQALRAAELLAQSIVTLARGSN